MGAIRMTMPTQQVIRALLRDPNEPMYGLQICDAARLPSGTIHPILARLERIGWLVSRWEKAEEIEGAGRPARRYYSFTKDGAETARVALAAAYQAQPTRVAKSRPLEAL